MCNITVVNKRKSPYDVYIGRGSIWGNPYMIGKDGDRDTVISKYKKYFIDGIKSGKFKKKDLQSLKGKTLGCFCKPCDCHGDVIKVVIEYLCEKGGLD